MIEGAANLPGDAPPKRAARGILSTPIPFGVPPASIMRREFRNALSGALGLAMLQLSLFLAWRIVLHYNGENLLFDQILRPLWLGSVAAALLLGAICGADEEETGTADFCRSLPVSPLRVFAEKIAGCALAFAVWAAVCIPATFLIAWTYEGEPFRAALERSLASPNFRADLQSTVAWDALFFCFGLAAGVWIRRVIPAAVVGGMLPIIIQLVVSADGASPLQPFKLPILFAAALVAFAAAAFRADRPEFAIPVFSTGSLFARGLFWKEWRAKRLALCVAAALVVFIPFVGAPLIAGLPLAEAGARTGRIHFFVAGLLISAGIMGSVFFTREERDPARSFLFELPLSRPAILRAKLDVLVLHQLILLGVALLAVAFLSSGMDHPFAAMLVTGALAIPAALLTALLSLHFRSALISLVVSAAFCLPFLFALSLQYWLSLEAGESSLAIRSILFNSAFAALVLAAWLFFVICRTPLLESGWGLRTFLAFVTGVVAVEFFATVLYCDYRDLAFILFGV